MSISIIATLVKDWIGLDPDSLGTAILPRVVQGRMRARGLDSAKAYAGLLVADPDEWAILQAELIVPETWFFRGGWDLFRSLARWVRDRAAGPPGRPVRILSVPCSTGEEPYSLAIALAEESVPVSAWQIDAVDLSAEQIARATVAQYSKVAFREPHPDLRPRYFVLIEEGRWELIPGIRERIRFRTGNLVSPEFVAGEAPYDMVLCRNLFIYLTDEARGRALTNLDRCLVSDGLLCLTPAEADRMPPGGYVPDGPIARATFRRAPTIACPDRPRSGSIPHKSRSPIASIELPLVAASIHPLGFARPGLPPVVDPFRVGRELADAGHLDSARLVCEEALTATPTAGLFGLLGVIHLAAGRRDDAAEAFRKALYLDPDDSDVLTHAIGLYDQLGHRGQADGLRRRLARLLREAPS